MAWFTSAASAPDVATNKDVVRQTYSIVGTTTVTYKRLQTIEQREIRGLTLAGADATILTLSGDYDVSDISRQPIGANGYNVRYTVTTNEDWEEI